MHEGLNTEELRPRITTDSSSATTGPSCERQSAANKPRVGDDQLVTFQQILERLWLEAQFLDARVQQVVAFARGHALEFLEPGSARLCRQACER